MSPAVPPEEAAFLNAIRANPADDLPRLAYADWLEERGDPRGRALRLACHFRQAWAELRDLLPALDGDWLADAFGGFRLVLRGYPADRKIAVIKLIREMTHCTLLEAKRLSEQLPARLGTGYPVADVFPFGPTAYPLPPAGAERRLVWSEAVRYLEAFGAVGAQVELEPRLP
jgi:uncharacterized protein (TIGR02996 family)